MSTYKCDTRELDPLTEEKVMTPYWERIKNASQEEKNSTLAIVMKNRGALPFCMHSYRQNIAATLFCGADPNAIETSHYVNSPLHIATSYDDQKLVELLLSRGANVHENKENKKGLGKPPIFSAKTVEVAQLLMEGLTPEEIKTLIETKGGEWGNATVLNILDAQYYPVQNATKGTLYHSIRENVDCIRKYLKGKRQKVEQILQKKTTEQ